MQIFRESVIYFVLLLGAGLVAVAEEGVTSTPLPTGNDYDNEGGPDSSEIIFEDNDEDEDNYLLEEIEDFKAQQKLYDEDMRLYETELEEFLKSKAKHEAEILAFDVLHSGIDNKLKEFIDTAQDNEQRFKAEWKELEGDDIHLKKKEDELAKEENDLAAQEATDAESEKELEKIIAEAHSLKADLEERTKEHQEFKQNLQRNATEEEERLKATFGICEPVHSELGKYLKVFDEDFTRMCYKPLDFANA